MRVLICGGRKFSDYRLFVRVIHDIEAERGRFTSVVHGGAKGADWLAHLWANSPIGRLHETVFAADWEMYGRGAGPMRNARMLSEGKPDLVVAFPGGRGTADMVRRAKRAGVEVIEIPAIVEASK